MLTYIIKPVTTNFIAKCRAIIDTWRRKGYSISIEIVKNSLYFMKIKIIMHANAAGCCILDKNLAAFHQYANQALAQYDFCSNFYDVNFERKAGAMDLGRLITEISRYTKIWGQGNPVPLIAVTNIPITPNTIRVMGARQDTLKIECGSVSFLKFFATDLIQDIQQYGCNCTIDIIGEANLNEYKGRITPQIFIKDYEIKEGAKSDFAEF